MLIINSMSFLPFNSSKPKNPEFFIRALSLVAILALAAGSVLAEEPKAPSTNRPTPDPSQEGNLRRGSEDSLPSPGGGGGGLMANRRVQSRRSAVSMDAPTSAQDQNLLLREVHYDGKLSDSQAIFTVNLDVESLSKGESSITLFDGDVALMPSKLPSGWRMVREGRQYR